MPNYSLIEPHPTLPHTHTVGTGRGGAGNQTRLSSESVSNGVSATGPASRTAIRAPDVSAVYGTGRGGAGNAARGSERGVFSFDEELARAARVAAGPARTPVYSVGRGGFGNMVGAAGKRESASAAGFNDDYGVGGAGVRVARRPASAAPSDLSTDSADSADSAKKKAAWRRSVAGLPRRSFVGKVARAE